MEVDPTRVCELLVGLPAVRVLGIVDEADGPLWVHVETRAERPVCAGCGGPVAIKERPQVELVTCRRSVAPLAWCGAGTDGRARAGRVQSAPGPRRRSRSPPPDWP